MVYQNAAHRLCADRIEVRATFPINTALIDKAHKSLVDQRCGLQRVPPTLGAKISRGKIAEFIVHERHELLSHVGGSLATRVDQNLGQIRGSVFHKINALTVRKPLTVHELRL